MPKICDSQIPNLSPFAVILEKKVKKYDKFIWFRPLFFGIAHSRTSMSQKL